MVKRYLLDSGPISDFIHKRHGVHERVRELGRQGIRVGTCTPVLGEVWAGAENSDTRERNLQRITTRISDLVVWPYDLQAARQFGVLLAELRRRGRPMQQVDIQVAAIALVLGDCTVVTTDSDLFAIPDLRVENWRVTA